MKLERYIQWYRRPDTGTIDEKRRKFDGRDHSKSGKTPV
jgi:hypothetical protein